ncbi:MAG: hypothetical protein ACREPC_15995, partial [Stenotrophomonas sp.]
MVKRRMMMAAVLAAAVPFAALSAPPRDDVQIRQTSGNPILPGWYADPEAAVFGDTYWIYPTTSKPYA